MTKRILSTMVLVTALSMSVNAAAVEPSGIAVDKYLKKNGTPNAYQEAWWVWSVVQVTLAFLGL